MSYQNNTNMPKSSFTVEPSVCIYLGDLMHFIWSLVSKHFATLQSTLGVKS